MKSTLKHHMINHQYIYCYRNFVNRCQRADTHWLNGCSQEDSLISITFKQLWAYLRKGERKTAMCLLGSASTFNFYGLYCKLLWSSQNILGYRPNSHIGLMRTSHHCNLWTIEILESLGDTTHEVISLHFISSRIRQEKLKRKNSLERRKKNTLIKKIQKER